MLAGCTVTPVPLNHSKPTFGYLFETIEQRIAYLTDTVGLPADTTAFLQGEPLDWLVLDCSSPPATSPPRNYNDLTRALETVELLQPKKTVLTHVGHHLDAWFMEGHWSLPDGVVTAHDGMALGAQP